MPYRCLCVILLAPVRHTHFCYPFKIAVPFYCIQGPSSPFLPFDTERLHVFHRTADSVAEPAVALPFLLLDGNYFTEHDMLRVSVRATCA